MSGAAGNQDSEGVFVGRDDDLDADKVWENWDKISDFSNAKPFFMGGEQSGKIFGLATAK